MSKKELLAMIRNIVNNNQIKVVYENGICVVSKFTALGWTPVIFVDDSKNIIEVDGVEYDL